MLSFFTLSLCTVTRSTGSFIVIIPVYYLLHKLKRNFFDLPKQKTGCWNRCIRFNQAVKYMFCLLMLVVVVGVMPILTVSLWKPYEMYCLSRLDTPFKVPVWCMDTFPNVYNYIQKEYWNVGLGSFLERPWYLTATSMFTNQLFFYILYRVIKG